MIIPQLQFQFQNMTSILQQQQFLSRYFTKPVLQYDNQVYPQLPSISQDSTYIFTQASVSSTWTINHNLGQFPSVTIVDGSGNVVLAEVQYINSNQIIVTFSQPFAGTAYLNV